LNLTAEAINVRLLILLSYPWRHINSMSVDVPTPAGCAHAARPRRPAHLCLCELLLCI